MGYYFPLPLFLGFILDLLLGDPEWMPHPVVFIGRFITFLETRIRRLFPQDEQGELVGGTLLTLTVVVSTFVASALLCRLTWAIWPPLGFVLQTLWCWQCLAMRCLYKEAMNVHRALTEEGLPAARRAVGRIVGRDTDELDETGVIRACVETVAENLSDGEIAPLLYMALGGAPLAMTYKAINTMDSMLGYKNDKYYYFGRASAKLDDAANYVPSRIAARLTAMACPLLMLNKQACTDIWRRDRLNHSSPNSAQTESAFAGAMGVQLGGTNIYFGKPVAKPTIGDALRPLEAEDIPLSCRLMYGAGLYGFWGALALRFCLWFILYCI